MPWYVWGQLGLGCLVVELLMPGGFFLLLFGTACIVVAVAAAFGLLETLAAQVTVMALFAAFLLVFVRPRLVERLRRRG
jgi:membrane protein implicated in regulation of membrane protease activity